MVLLSFAVLMGGIMEVGLAGLISNAVSFAAQRAARYASVRGSASGHAATAADIQTVAQQYATPLSTNALTVSVTWTPNNTPGSTVQVVVSYAIRPAFLPLSGGPLTFAGTARQVIVQEEGGAPTAASRVDWPPGRRAPGGPRGESVRPGVG
jgi:Flp pilus assembly protein TadG